MRGSYPTQTFKLHYSSEAVFQRALPGRSAPTHTAGYLSSNSLSIFFAVTLQTLSPVSVRMFCLFVRDRDEYFT